jgi:hypothetical protein
MAEPAAVRLADDALGMRPRSYGHLLMLAGGYARVRLDGREVRHRVTGWRIGLRGPELKYATAPGTPSMLLLALPALPAMLARARYLRSLPERPRESSLRRLHLFAATATIAGEPVACWLIVRQDHLGRLFFYRLLLQEAAVARRDAGGGTPAAADADESASPPANGDAVLAPSTAASSDSVAATLSPTPQAEVPVYEPRAPIADWEKLPPGDARDAAAHGYSLDEWLALQRGEPWTSPAPSPLPGFWTRLSRGLGKDLNQVYGGSYGMAPEIYEALGGDRAVLTHLVWQPAAGREDRRFRITHRPLSLRRRHTHGRRGGQLV